ncbi:MAG: hypothetical protein KAR11_07700 [Phycisphaerae bacterium]|nr:hypothetical protein [Phycisphaerae bacterium]
MIVAGIDEAGLGPVLGPLVVSGVAMRVDTPAGETPPPTPDLWAMLDAAISRKSSRKKTGPITIGDSKKLYNRKKSNGLVPLERGVLTMLSTRTQGAQPQRKIPTTLAELLGDVDLPLIGSGGAMQRAKPYAWYADCELPLPRQAGPTDIELTGNAVLVAMRAAGIELLDMQAQPIFAGDYNRMIAATQNKSTTTFDVTLNLLMWLWNSCRDDDVRIIVDRQGGRVHYRTPLQRVFPDCSLKVIGETQLRSAYLLRAGSRTVEVSFVVGGESACLATALASMLSKYLRELFMEMFNSYWLQQLPDLKPTAGYYVDGNRFYGEIQNEMQKLGISEDSVLRCR